MTLSDAIRLGAAVRPQVYCALFKDGGSCTLGAAHEGYTGSVSFLGVPVPLEVWPILQDGIPSLAARIVNLNDEKGWTRERIADWLDELAAEHGWDLESKIACPYHNQPVHTDPLMVPIHA